MKYRKVKNSILLSLEQGDYINQSILKVFNSEKLQFGWISGLGAVYDIELGYYDLEEKKYIKRKVFEDHEIVSLTGNVTFVDNEHFVHTHIVISDSKFQTLGGHLFDAKTSATGELKIDFFDIKIDRKFSNKIGLNLWCLYDESNKNK